MSHDDTKRRLTTHSAEGSEQEDLDQVRLDARLVWERAVMQVAVAELAHAGDVLSPPEYPEPRNWMLDEWRIVFENCISQLACEDRGDITGQEKCAVALFVEERLSVLTCGGLFDGSEPSTLDLALVVQ